MPDQYSNSCADATGIIVVPDYKTPCKFVPMSELGKRIESARKAKGMSMPGLAKAAGGLTYQTIQNLEQGKSKGTKHILAIARALGVDPDWLQFGGAPSVAPTPKPAPATSARAPEPYPAGLERLPVYGMAACGPDGWSLWNGEIIDTIHRPANLAGAPNAYAVYVVGSSMENRYYSGELAHIHPGKPVDIGSFVLVQLRPEPGESTPKAVLKRLAKRSATKVTLEQFNPPKKFDIALGDVLSMHRVVGSSEG
jgi:phage repressor protein C with HTH and peptisase S24 domain